MPIDPERHRDTQRRYKERMFTLGAPGTADIQRSLALAVRSACAHFVNTGHEAVLAFIVRDAARRLADANFTPSEVSQRLQRALMPAVIDQIDGECERLPDAEADQHQDAEVAEAPGTGM